MDSGPSSQTVSNRVLLIKKYVMCLLELSGKLLKSGETVTAIQYCEQLDKFKNATKRKKNHIWVNLLFKNLKNFILIFQIFYINKILKILTRKIISFQYKIITGSVVYTKILYE